MPATRAATARFEAPPNIALVKYWGIRDEALGLPFNSSLSVTLDRLRTRTSVRFDARFARDRFTLDGVGQTGGAYAAVVRLLEEVRASSGVHERAEVVSSNNFPTASGLASSASGFAALAGAASAAAGLELSPRALSTLARKGSGSACRSLFGGFVEWRAGVRADGSDCYAHEIFGPSHWPELVDLVLLVEEAPRKTVRSSEAMQTSVRTSPEYAARLREIPRRMHGMRVAIRDRDAPELFRLVLEECDSFRSVCETTEPSLDYLTGTSRRILEAVRTVNAHAREPIAAYTHDAGAHVHVFTLRESLPRLERALRGIDGIRRRLRLHPGPGARPLAS